MSVKFENMELKISLWDILNELTDEQKHEIAEHLIWDQAIFDDFVDRIATERVVTDSFNSNLYKARLRLIERIFRLRRNSPLFTGQFCLASSRIGLAALRIAWRSIFFSSFGPSALSVAFNSLPPSKTIEPLIPLPAVMPVTPLPRT